MKYDSCAHHHCKLQTSRKWLFPQSSQKNRNPVQHDLQFAQFTIKLYDEQILLPKKWGLNFELCYPSTPPPPVITRSSTSLECWASSGRDLQSVMSEFLWHEVSWLTLARLAGRHGDRTPSGSVPNHSGWKDGQTDDRIGGQIKAKLCLWPTHARTFE